MNRTEHDAEGILSTFAETALLIVPRFSGQSDHDCSAALAELKSLTDTMGLVVQDGIVALVREPKSRYLFGSGKAREIAELADDLEVDCIIFDEDLSPSQQRNWEALTRRCVIDRHEVILDIFATRASTREAVLQVGLARMEYSLPRLTRAWTHLSRQRGGRRGTRGEGETQLEVDRRIVLRKIARMKEELVQVRRNRTTMRKQRESVPVPTAAIVGYTNAGKSSLLHKLTGADLLIEDKLFATLDPTTRRIKLEGGNELLLTDTVGFIRKLPHDLVDAFKSTLEETVLADFLLHILDASNPEVEDHMNVTRQVLQEIGAGEKPVLTCFNKIDVCDEMTRDHLMLQYPGAVFFSVHTGEGLEKLPLALEEMLYSGLEVDRFLIPPDRHDLVALVHRNGKVRREEYSEAGILMVAMVPAKVRGLLKEYRAGKDQNVRI
jgi:GTPase